MTTPVDVGLSGVARNAPNVVPSAEASVKSSCETAAPAILGIGGSESVSKHMGRTYLLRSAVTSIELGHTSTNGREAASLQKHVGQVRRASVLEGAEGARRPGCRV